MSRAAPSGGNLALWRIAAFAAPAAPLLALNLPTIIFLPQYFIRDLGIEAGAAVFVIARVFDIFIDPALGGWQDRTVAPWGRRRTWLALSCPVLMLIVWWCFLGLTQSSGVIAALIATLALFSAYSSMMIAHLGWAGELIPTYHGRTRVLGYVQAASLIGQVGVLAVAAYVQSAGGGGGEVVAAMGWTLLIALPIAASAALAAPERRLPPQSHLSFIEAVRTVWRNLFARRVLLVDMLLGVAQGVAGTLFLYFAQLVLGLEREANVLLFIYFVAGLIGVPVWMMASRRYGKHRALQAAFLWTAASALLLAAAPAGSFPIAAVLLALAGLSQGGSVMLSRALMADVVDDDELKTGARRSGLYFGLLLTTSKAALVSGPAALVMLQVFGFDAGAGAHNSPAMLNALAGAFILGAAIPVLLGFLALRGYPLDENAQAALAAAIEARHAKNSENTLGPSTR